MTDCPRRTYHDYAVKGVIKNAQLEQCAYCGDRQIFRLDNQGRNIRVHEYRDTHVRAFAQPEGKNAKIFYKMYGAKPVEDVKKAENQQHSRKKNSMERLRDYEAYVKGDRNVFGS